MQREAPLVPNPLEIVIGRRPVTTDMVLFLCSSMPTYECLDECLEKAS